MHDKVLDILRERPDTDASTIYERLNISQLQLAEIISDLNRNNDNLFIEEYHIYHITNLRDLGKKRVVFVLQEN